MCLLLLLLYSYHFTNIIVSTLYLLHRYRKYECYSDIIISRTCHQLLSYVYPRFKKNKKESKIVSLISWLRNVNRIMYRVVNVHNTLVGFSIDRIKLFVKQGRRGSITDYVYIYIYIWVYLAQQSYRSDKLIVNGDYTIQWRWNSNSPDKLLFNGDYYRKNR